jgi:hypothetical protein
MNTAATLSSIWWKLDGWFQRRWVDRVAAEREGAGRVAVEGAVERDHPRAPGQLAGQLEGALDRLGPAVRQVDVAERIGQQPGEPRGKLHLRRADVLAVDHHVRVAPRLLGDGARHIGVGVTDRGDADPGEQVEVLATVEVPDARSARAPDGDRARRVRRLREVAEEAFAQQRGALGRAGDARCRR